MVETVEPRAAESDPQELLADALCRIENLEIALRTSRRIGVAIGVLMGQHGWTEDEAFAALRSASQRRHRKLRDIAEEVALTGDLP